MFNKLKEGVKTLGKPEWRPMLEYVASLHEVSTHPPEDPFDLPWEEIGPGYVYGPAFGHIDIVHQALDVVAYEPEHAINQILNNLKLQTEDGLIPGAIWMKGKYLKKGESIENINIENIKILDNKIEAGKASWATDKTVPPLWPVLIDEHNRRYGITSYIKSCFTNLVRQIEWFENNRRANDGGFFYLDIFKKVWESGVDDGIRYFSSPQAPVACVDASSHMYMLYETAARWAEIIDCCAADYKGKAAELKAFISQKLFCDETGMFHDIWSVSDSSIRVKTFEGIWPVVTGAATLKQAVRVIDENLLNPERFFSPHPITSVSMDEPLFELRMWRGPVWNCMTMWAAKGCLRYGRKDAAKKILEKALDATARQFVKTGTVWEFYNPFEGEQSSVARKPYTAYNIPCRDYLGHMPVIAMAEIWEST